jgi:hypothetical protein
MNENIVILKHPFTAIFAGPSQAGKTEFIIRLMQNINEMITPIPQNVIYCYSIWQEKFTRMKEILPEIKFNEGVASISEINENENNLLILDDLMKESGQNDDVMDMFSKGSHHKNFSVILVSQNLFHQAKNTRTISLNAHYLVIFNNPRDKSQIKHLSRQMYPSNPLFLDDAYEDATSTPYSYLFIDLTQTTVEEDRVRTKIFPDEDGIKYIKNKK